jgi:hypothetical protein
MKAQPSAARIRIGTCDREVVGMLGFLVRQAGWKRVLAAMESVAVDSGQPGIGGTILAAREWLFGSD